MPSYILAILALMAISFGFGVFSGVWLAILPKDEQP